MEAEQTPVVELPRQGHERERDECGVDASGHAPVAVVNLSQRAARNLGVHSESIDSANPRNSGFGRAGGRIRTRNLRVKPGDSSAFEGMRKARFLRIWPFFVAGQDLNLRPPGYEPQSGAFGRFGGVPPYPKNHP